MRLTCAIADQMGSGAPQQTHRQVIHDQAKPEEPTIFMLWLLLLPQKFFRQS